MLFASLYDYQHTGEIFEDESAAFQSVVYRRSTGQDAIYVPIVGELWGVQTTMGYAVAVKEAE